MIRISETGSDICSSVGGTSSPGFVLLCYQKDLFVCIILTQNSEVHLTPFKDDAEPSIYYLLSIS